MSEDPIGFEAGDANIRRYVSNSAIMFVDPTGLDIYIENTQQVGGFHQGITVDLWDVHGRRIGSFSISFGLDKGLGCGVVYEDTDPPKKETKRFGTTKAEDRQIRELFLRLIGQTGEYDVARNNCRKFSNDLFQEIKNSLTFDNGVPDDTNFPVDPPSPLPTPPTSPINKPPGSRPSIGRPSGGS